MYHRKPAVAGAFYSSNRAQLVKDIEGYIGEADVKNVTGDVVGLISPHAGYIYSGPVAAYSYKLLTGSGVGLAIVLAPSHRARFEGASIIPEGSYETPLGKVEIDSDIGNLLLDKPKFSFLKEAHVSEHSLEVQVPFLQVALDNFKIVPLVIGTINLDDCRAIAKGISEALRGAQKKFAVIISTDLSHYHSYKNAVEMDKIFIDALLSFDENRVKNILSSGKAEACGEGPVLAGMALCRELGAKRVELLKYANSGDTAGDKSQVVGYLSAAILK